MANRKSAGIGVHSFVATVALDCSTSVVTEKILIRYEGNVHPSVFLALSTVSV